MKQYQDYKKLFLNKIYGFLFVTVLVFIPVFFIYAQTAEEVQNKIEQKNADIANLEKEIDRYKSELNSIGKQKNTLSSSIKELDVTKSKLNADISLSNKKIDKVNLELGNLSSDIGQKEFAIDNNKLALMLDLRRISEFEQKSLTENLLSNDNLASIWNTIDNMQSIRGAILSKMQDLKKVKGELEYTKTETELAKNEINRLKAQLADEKKIVENNAKEKNLLLKKTKNNESSYQDLLKNRTALKNALEKEVESYESQLKFILDPKKLPGVGALSWPLDDIYITQLFGRTVDAARLYASGSHSGVDFRASVGTPVNAMSAGVVIGIGDTDSTCPGASFGKWVFIEYDNGLASTFGHLSLIKATEGQRVSRGDVVAYSGATGHVTGPHLHATVYAGGAAEVKTFPSKSCAGKTLTQPLAAKNAYLDPMLYLPPYKK